MITVNKVEKTFGLCKVLKGVNCKIAAGEMVAIMGPSGAGKTTLLNIIGTLDFPDSGSVFIDDKPLAMRSSEELASFRNNTIGFIFQQYNLLAEFTAIENVSVPAYISKNFKTKRQIEERAEELLTLVKLGDRLHHKPTELSGGEQQRVSIARALINSPKIILADEPTGNLDSIHALGIYDLFYSLNKAFKFTFVITTHNTSLAEKMDRTLYMQDGILSV